jgi:RNA recognition motif-containing protein
MEIMLYVGNFAKTTSENELRSLFSQVGRVTSMKIMKDRKSGESTRYGFLTMSAESEANRAVSRFDNHLMGANKLKVILTKPRLRTGTPGSLLQP